jgi:hypothetical protein
MATLSEPANGLENVGTETVFSWSSIAGATAYELQISLNETFQSPEQVRDLTETSHTKTMEQSQIYYWRVRGYNTNVASDWSEIFSFTTGVRTSAGEDDMLPKEFFLEQNYPNPFNPTTQIRFSLPKTTEVKLEVFNILGQPITVLVDGRLSAGFHTVEFNGDQVTSGVYLVKLTSSDFTQTRLMNLLK